MDIRLAREGRHDRQPAAPQCDDLANAGRSRPPLGRAGARRYMPVRHLRARFYDERIWSCAAVRWRIAERSSPSAANGWHKVPGAAHLRSAKGPPRTTTGKIHKPSLARELAFRAKV